MLKLKSADEYSGTIEMIEKVNKAFDIMNVRANEKNPNRRWLRSENDEQLKVGKKKWRK
jgi:hypothetical protein